MDEASPPPWAAALFSRLEGKIASLESRINALSISEPAPALPEKISPEALEALTAHTGVPPDYQAFLPVLQIALRAAASPEEVEQCQHAYDQVVLVLNESAPPTPDEGLARPPRSRSRSPQSQTPSRPRFQTQNGRKFYVARSGKKYDISRPPPYPCKECKENHWYWESCSVASTSAPSRQNSRPVAPRRQAATGSSIDAGMQ